MTVEQRNEDREEVVRGQNENLSAPLYEPIPPRYVPWERIDALVKLQPGHPNFPMDSKFTFRETYKGSNNYRAKHSLASWIMQHPDFKDFRMLVSDFQYPGDEPTDEIESYKKDIQYRVREELLKRGDRAETKTAEGELKTFAENVVKNNTPDAKEFRKLIGLFGSSRVIDILYKNRPEFRGIPVDKVKGVLADYLGDFLNVKSGFQLQDLESGIQYLSDPNLKEGLVEVIKDSCLTICQQEKKRDPNIDLKAVISKYLDSVMDEATTFESLDLEDVALKVYEFYDSTFQIERPSNMVTQLREGRDFPDIGQLINTKEIEDKKRFIEGDDMGLGKSLPPILVKERKGIKTAIITAPANVINDKDAWQAYLSDRVGPDGKQLGYFKEGQAPSVLVVDQVAQLKVPNVSDYDYILISHEKLTDRYVDELLKIDYGMLIPDEVHKLKKLAGGSRAKNLLKLADKIEGDDKYLVMISGTPVPNKISDVAMLLKLTYPERFREVDDKRLVRMIINGEYIDLRSLIMPRMQVKNIQDSLELPQLTEVVERVEMSKIEREIYEILLEEDEVEATEKIRILRQFLLNPELLNITPELSSTKIESLNKSLKQTFLEKNRALVFVNDYIEGIIRGENSIIEKLDLPEDIQIKVIHGGTTAEEREVINAEFRGNEGKILLLVSGQTADVGVNYSNAKAVDHYNEPWTKYKKDQENSRVYREGILYPLTSKTHIVADSIEEGIHEYIYAKFKAIEKLLKGIPVTELEKEMIIKSENEDEGAIEVSPELAEYYFSAWDKMRQIFGHVKELGEDKFKEFLKDWGEDYAKCYVDLGSRSYQANAARVSGTILDAMVKERNQNISELNILDLASGPQMLKRHVPDPYASRILSIDINPLHFSGPEVKIEKDAVGSYREIPLLNDSVDYANLALAWHYSNFVPSRNQFERLEVLRELHRVLKIGGRVMINSIYSIEMRDEEKLKEVFESVGFRIVSQYSGLANEKNNFQSTIYTLEKREDLSWSQSELIQLIGKENFDGLKFRNNDRSLKDTRRILKQFELYREDGTRPQIPIILNKEDQKVLDEEENIISTAESLKSAHKSIDAIPKERVLDNNFTRVKIGSRYALFKRLETASGFVVIK